MLHDFRFAFRQLVKARAFTAAAVIVLALGIGANTAIFSLMNTLLFQPPHYAKANEIVQVFSQDKKNPKTFRGFSYPTYLDIRDQNSVFSGVMAHNLAMVGVGDKGSTRRAFTDVVSANYFSVMGVMPMQGRSFRAEEETPGRNSAVAMGEVVAPGSSTLLFITTAHVFARFISILAVHTGVKVGHQEIGRAHV